MPWRETTVVEVDCMHRKTQDAVQSRIQLDQEMLSRFFEDIHAGDVSRLARGWGLPYSLVYNLVHGRIRSLSGRDYRIIFGVDPSDGAVDRVDGGWFRKMVRLWLFLHENVSKAALYRELFPDERLGKVDYRIFTGKVQTVAARVDVAMTAKFLDQGLDRSEIKDWIREFEQLDEETRVPYETTKPILEYLETHLGVNPTRLLRQSAFRYESGELNTVSRKVYEHARQLRVRTEQALRLGSRLHLERLKEDIYGDRKGLTLYAHVREDLKLLQDYGGKSPRIYLGRSISHYEKVGLKRVASWRARKIREDALRLIRDRPDIPVAALPGAPRKRYLAPLLSTMRRLAVARMIDDRNQVLEKQVLSPSRDRIEEFRRDVDNHLTFDQAARLLRMSKPAFDLMVAANSHSFRKVATFNGDWHLPRGYLQEVYTRSAFPLIKAKYALLADSLQGDTVH
jgi:hypothetical protein